MRWNIKQNQPEKGTIQTIKKFLWLPILIGTEYRWLEKASYEQIWKVDAEGNGKWIKRKWL